MKNLLKLQAHCVYNIQYIDNDLYLLNYHAFTLRRLAV